MLEHVSVPITDFNASKKFYVAALAPLGYELYRDYGPDAGGFCEGDSTSFWIARHSGKITPIHVALQAQSKEAVKAFHKKGLEAGGKDNGKPGFREDYGDDYYAAFLYDPDGNNIEACYFGERASQQ